MAAGFRSFVLAAALLGATGVGLGAFGAHALQKALSPAAVGADESARLLNTWEVAVRYQLYHALALLGTGLLARQSPSRILATAGTLFLSGVLVFSGCLYALVMTRVKILGAVVPLGGVLLIAGWIALAAAACQRRSVP